MTIQSAPTLQSTAPSNIQSKVFKLAWPVIGENFLQTMLGIVDTLLVGMLGAAAIAGVGAAVQLMFFVISALSAIGIGSSVLVAQAVGAQAFPRARLFAKQSLVWSVIISIPLVLVGLFAADPLMALFGMEPEVARIGADYLQVTMGTAVALTVFILGSGVLRGAGDSRTPMLVTVVANVLNVFLTYGLIFGAFGLPELGVMGSAWGTLYARLFAAFLLLFVLWRGRNGVDIRGRSDWWPRGPVAKDLLQIGIPAALEQLLISSAFLGMMVVVAQLGTATLAAHRIAFNALSLSFLPGMGFGIAATTLVGQSIGARNQDEGREATRIATIWAVVWMGVMGLAFIFLATPIMRLFTDDPEVIRIGAAGLWPVALSQPFWAILFVQGSALRGTGNTQFPLRVNGTGVWVAVALGAMLEGFVGGGLVTLWMTFLIVSPLMSLLLWRRFHITITGELVPAL